MGTTQNLVVLSGTVSREPALRELTGGVVLQFDLTTELADGATTSVPVAWHDPTPKQSVSIGAGDDVIVIGTVRRRFFRVGGQTQSRTEVVVESVIGARRAKTANSALEAAAASIRRVVGPRGRSAASA